VFFELVSVSLASVKWQKSSQRVNLTLHFLPMAILAKLPRGVFSEEPIAHPFIEGRDMKSEAGLAFRPNRSRVSLSTLPIGWAFPGRGRLQSPRSAGVQC
jgi:hypothetical protein